LWYRCGGGIQHGTGEWGSGGVGCNRAARAGGRSDPASDAVIADEFFTGESRVLAGVLCRNGGDPGGGGARAVFAIRRSAVVVFPDRRIGARFFGDAVLR